MRKQNERLARAIKRVKENPELVEQVAAMEQVDEEQFLQDQIQSRELERLRLENKSEMRRRDQIRKETEGTQAQLDELTEEADMLQKLLREYE